MKWILLLLFISVGANLSEAAPGLRLGMLAGVELRKVNDQSMIRGASARLVGVAHWNFLGIFTQIEARGANEFEESLGGLIRVGNKMFLEFGAGLTYVSQNALNLTFVGSLGYDFPGRIYVALYGSQRNWARERFVFGPLIGARF